MNLNQSNNISQPFFQNLKAPENLSSKNQNSAVVQLQVIRSAKSMKCDINSIELGHRSHLDWKCGNRDNSETYLTPSYF